MRPQQGADLHGVRARHQGRFGLASGQPSFRVEFAAVAVQQPYQHARGARARIGAVVGGDRAGWYVEGGARGVDDAGPAAQCAAQGVQRGDGSRRVDLGAAASLGAGRGRVGADDGDGGQGRGVQGKDVVVVAEQDARRGDGPAQQRPVAAVPAGGDRPGAVRAEGADACGQPQQAPYLVVDGVLRDLARVDRVGQGGGPRAVRAGHGQVQCGAGGLPRGAHGGPVGDDDPVEAPVGLQDLREQRTGGHGVAVDAVVRGHDEPHARLHGPLERRQVHLAQDAVRDPDVDGEAVGLGVVGDEVLGRGRDALGLDAADQRGAGAAGQFRVLGEALEVPATERAAVQVEGGREDDVHPFADRLGREEAAQFGEEFLVPQRAEGGGRGQQRGGAPLVPGLPAHPGRPVGADHRPQSQVRFGGGAPGGGAGEQAHLPVEAQLVDQPVELFVVHPTPCRRRRPGPPAAGRRGDRAVRRAAGAQGSR